MYETLLNKYGVKQLGYYVRDINDAANVMARLLGAGPFVDAGESTPERCVYRGKESTMTTRVALGQFADMQIELIEVTSEGPNVYSEMGHYGLHHLCVRTDDLAQTIKEFEDAGFEQAVSHTDMTHPQGYDEMFEGIAANAVKGIPLGRVGTPQDCAKGILFLASDASAWTTGDSLAIDGGELC